MEEDLGEIEKELGPNMIRMYSACRKFSKS